MVDIADSKWTEEDDGNTAPSPDGVQSGYAPRTIAPILKGMRGAIKRQYNRINAMYTSTGNGAAYVVTPEVPLPVYTKGERVAFFANAANTGPVTLNISGLGAKTVLRSDGAPLTPNEIKVGGFVEVVYNGTAFNVVGYSQPTNVNVVGTLTAGGSITASAFVGNGWNLTDLDASKVLHGTLSDARLPATMAGKAFTSPVYVGASGSLHGDGNVYGSVWGNEYLSNHLPNTYFKKVGGEIVGDLRISKAYPMINLFYGGVNHVRQYVESDGSYVVGNGDNGEIYSRLYTNGSFYTKQFGDLLTWLNANKVQKTGDRMSGQLQIEANIALQRGNTNRYIHYDGPNGNIGFLNTGGGWSFRVDNGGTSYSNGSVYAGGAFLETNGNVQGSIWTNWGHWDAYTAINARIENRASAQGSAWANDRVANLQYRLVSLGETTATDVPAGAVSVGGYVPSQTLNGFRNRYRYPQVYDPVRGWVGFSNQ